MFYGAVVKPGVTVNLNAEDGEVLHLSGACLHNASNDERTYLILHQDEKDHIVCVLKKDVTENVPLDLFVATRNGGHFKIQGKSEVHLIGYYEPLMSESEEEDEDEVEDEDLDGISDDEEMEGILSAKGKKGLTAENEEDDESDEDADENEQQENEETDEDDDDDNAESSSEDEEEEEVRKAIKQHVQLGNKNKKGVSDDKNKKPTVTVNNSKPVVPATTSDASKKRKAAEAPLAKPGKQQKSPAAQPAGGAATGQFEKAVSDYLKKHGRCLISQVASACPKPASVTTKYREFLVSRSVFNVEGQHVSLKA